MDDVEKTFSTRSLDRLSLATELRQIADKLEAGSDLIEELDLKDIFNNEDWLRREIRIKYAVAHLKI